MANYQDKAPGVYIEEITPAGPIAGIGTSVAAFIGLAMNGLTESPIKVTNWSEYRRTFGGFSSGRTDIHLPHAVKGFFDNGGTSAYVIRIGTASPATLDLNDRAKDAKNAKPTLVVKARTEEPSADGIHVEIEDSSLLETKTTEQTSQGGFTLRLESVVMLQPGSLIQVSTANQNQVQVGVINQILDKTVTIELPLNFDVPAGASVKSLEFTIKVYANGDDTKPTVYSGSSMLPSHPRYFERIVNADDTGLIRLYLPSADNRSDMSPDSRPATLKKTKLNAAIRYPPTIGPSDRQNWVTNALTRLQEKDDVSIVCAPGITDQPCQEAIKTHCEMMRDRVAILDAPDNYEEAKTQVEKVRSRDGFAGLYYPWLLVGDQTKVPPSGHIAGIYARVDSNPGVHKAPANELIAGASGLTQPLTDAKQGELNKEGINCLRVFPRGGPVVWGARTTSDEMSWRYINVRRLFLYVEKSIQEGIRWAVFEPNDTLLWKKLERTITEFLTRVWQSGALFGRTAKEAFYVKIDEELNPPAVRALGQVNIEVGIAPVRPAEFVVVRIGMWEGGARITEL